MSRTAVVVLCALLLNAWTAGAQATGAQAGGAPAGGTQTGTAQDRVPQPYAPGEFPGWLGDVFRAEAVFVGAFPLSLFVTLEVYDSWRYFTNGLDPQYAPWPFGSGAAATYDSTETLWLAVSAVSLSLTVSGIDFLLGRLRDGSPTH